MLYFYCSYYFWRHTWWLPDRSFLYVMIQKQEIYFQNGNTLTVSLLYISLTSSTADKEMKTNKHDQIK